MRMFILSCLIIIFLFTACKKDTPQLVFDPEIKTFTDPRDGQSYPIVKIGEQFWFARNLNFESNKSWCYKDDPESCAAFGKLYDWHTALTVCPDGWHLPTEEEWETLVETLGGKWDAGGTLKSTTGWATPNLGATNSSGFSGLPGGFRDVNGNYVAMDSSAIWWSATKDSFFPETFATKLSLRYDHTRASIFVTHLSSGVSCRCLKD